MSDLTTPEFVSAMMNAEAEYYSQQNEVKPIPCRQCTREGRDGIMMIYRGLEYHEQTVLKQIPDENSPGGFDYQDEVASCPYAVWRCEHGHEWTEGY